MTLLQALDVALDAVRDAYCLAENSNPRAATRLRQIAADLIIDRESLRIELGEKP